MANERGHYGNSNSNTLAEALPPGSSAPEMRVSPYVVVGLGAAIVAAVLSLRWAGNRQAAKRANQGNLPPARVRT